MPQERRYTKFKQSDVWNMLANLENALKVQILRGTAHGSSVSLIRLDTGERLRAVIRLVHIPPQLLGPWMQCCCVWHSR